MIKKKSGAQIGNQNKKTHGMKHTRLYSIWVGMKTRCLNKNHTWYKHYGGKGIKVCSRWLKFLGFYNDMYKSYEIHLKNYSEADTTLDRIDNSKNYCKENCRWATKLEQSNNASNNVFIEFAGKKQSLKDWSIETGIPYGKLWLRIFNGKRELKYALDPKIDFRSFPRKSKNKTYGSKKNDR